jgi:hypothetical protein
MSGGQNGGVAGARPGSQRAQSVVSERRALGDACVTLV